LSVCLSVCSFLFATTDLRGSAQRNAIYPIPFPVYVVVTAVKAVCRFAIEFLGMLQILIHAQLFVVIIVFVVVEATN
jgi:hypothetical protein